MFRRRNVKSKVIIVGQSPNFFFKILAFLFLSGLLLLPLLGYLFLIKDPLLLSDYRQVLAAILFFNRSQLNILPDGIMLSESLKLLETAINLQVFISLSLLIMLIALRMVRVIVETVTSRSFVYFGAISARYLQKLVYWVFNIKSRIMGDIRPYVFFTKVEVEVRGIKKSIGKSLWFTLIIFATSFQFAGLFFTQTAFPRFFGRNFSILDGSVVFMIITGIVWITLLLGIDLLERFDIQILDLSSSRLANIGKNFNRISRRGFSFLTLSFLILAIQNFDIRAWLQSVVFLDIFCLITFWILIGYESNLEEIGHQVRGSIDRRTLTGAERVVINREKKRFGEQKIKEAEEKMKAAEKRVFLAERVGFVRSLIESVLLLLFVLVLFILIIMVYTSFIGQLNIYSILYVEVIFSLLFIVGMLIFQNSISQNDIIRNELVFFPLFLVGNAITHYLLLIDTSLNYLVFLISVLTFNIFWFILILGNIYTRMPGMEFWGLFKHLVFVITIAIVWSLTIYFQLQYVGNPDFFVSIF